MRTFVVVRTRFAALHCWPECNIKGKEYLKSPHRHEFHVELWFDVKHDDRDIEFIQAKEYVDRFITTNWEGEDLEATSCEMMAQELATMFQAVRVSVFEDGENGSVVITDLAISKTDTGPLHFNGEGI